MAPSDRSQTETQEVPLEHQEIIFYSEDWHKLPREVMESPCLDILRSCLDTSWLATGSRWPCWRGGLDQVICSGPFQPYSLCDSPTF